MGASKQVKQPNNLLRYEREKKGWSQGRLAELLGADTSMISCWECGDRKPSLFYQEKLCHLFGKDAEALGLIEQRESTQSAQTPISSLTFYSGKPPLFHSSHQATEVSTHDPESSGEMNRRDATRQITTLISTTLFLAPRDVFNPQS